MASGRLDDLIGTDQELGGSHLQHTAAINLFWGILEVPVKTTTKDHRSPAAGGGPDVPACWEDRPYLGKALAD